MNRDSTIDTDAYYGEDSELGTDELDLDFLDEE